MTPLTQNMGIVVRGSELTTGFVFQCPIGTTTLQALPESTPFPADLICLYQVAPGAKEATPKRVEKRTWRCKPS